ncbi:MAG: shikimate kinase [Elusimicrobiales bacterium]
MKIVIYGFMASGKTTIGRLVAKKLKLPFYDTDIIFEKKYKTPVYKFIKGESIKRFREIEKKIFLKLLEIKKDCVISVGGGIFPRGKKNIIEIFIDTPYTLLKKRFSKAKKTRPLLEQKNSDIRKLYLSRIRKYKKARFKITEENSFNAARKIVKIYYDEKNKNKE